MRSQRLYLRLVVCIYLLISLSGAARAGDAAIHPVGPVSGMTLAVAGLALFWSIFLACRRRERQDTAPPVTNYLICFLMAMAAFAAVGLTIAFGHAAGMPFGVGDGRRLLAAAVTERTGPFLVYMAAAGAMAAALVAAVGGRLKLRGQIFVSVLISSLISPVFLHWSSGDLVYDNVTAFLSLSGFTDRAGSITVHASVGWAILAALMVLKDQSGGTHGQADPPLYSGGLFRPIPAAMLLLAALVASGWLIASVPRVGETSIALNMLSAVVAGASVAGLVNFRRSRRISLHDCIFGALAGTVAVAAGCGVLTPAAAAVIGGAGAMAALTGNDLVARRLGVDDRAGAVGLHAFAGTAGALLLALFAPADELSAASRLAQLWVQAVGAGINFYWSFGMTYLALWTGCRLLDIRTQQAPFSADPAVSPHIGFDQLERGLGRWLDGRVSSTERLPVITGHETERLSILVNRLMNRVEDEAQRYEKLLACGVHDDAERVAALAKATFEAILIHRDGIIIDGNEEFEKLVDRPLSELVGQSIYDFLRDGQTIAVSEVIKRNDNETHELSIVLPSGEELPVAARGRDILYRGEKARVGCFVDLRERKEAERRIRYLAQHDPLTGLPNRVLFSEHHAAIAAKAEPYGVAVIDIDRFKDINDIHGHQAGDAVIREVSARLLAAAGQSNIVARLAGDEFAVILRQAGTVADLETFGSAVLAAMAAPIALKPGMHLNVTVSLGAALSPDHASQTAALVGCADIALVHAKSSGRNAFRPFRAGMNDLIEKRRALESDLELALGRGEFELYLQPRVAVEEARISGYEALLRWRHPTLGMVSPADFIPVAEASGKIIQLGEWVLAEAVRLLDRIDGHISVNVSPLQFRHTGFVSRLAELISRTKADPRRIELEITESVLIDDDRRALQILQEVKEMGFAIALDDFGTGYSSLSYLSRYPFDTIKIDRSFVANLTVTDSARMIIGTIINLGTGLGMRVVAEGVETIEEARFLGGAGCHELQGYLLGRPRPLTDIVRELDPAIAEELQRLPRRLPEIQDIGSGDVRLRLVSAKA